MIYKYPFTSASENLKKAVFARGMTCVQDGKTFDDSIWKWDKCGAVMKFSEHGNRDSKYGWEIDHIQPISKGGSDELSNLQPLNWKNNSKKGDTYPWNC